MTVSSHPLRPAGGSGAGPPPTFRSDAGRLPLTATGWWLMAGALVACLAGAGLGYRAMVAVGIGGVGLIAAAGVAVLIRPKVELSRTVTPERLTVGEPALGRLTVHNLTRWPAPGFVAVDRIGGEPVEHVVTAMGGAGWRTVHYEIPARRRGLLRLGPLTVRRTDPFGLMRRSQQQAADDTIWVYPRIHPMRALPVGRVPDFEGRRAEVAHSGTVTFSSLRAYVPGDDPRRIHWRTTARVGQLMVREHVDTTEPTTTIVLDTRAPVLDDDVFEHAVEATASIADSAVRSGRPANVVVVGEDPAELARIGAVSLLDRLAAASRIPEANPLVLLDSVERTPPGGALVVVTSAREKAVVARLAQQRRRFSPVVVVIIADVGGDRALPYRRSGMAVLPARSGAEAAAVWDRMVLGELR